MLACTHTRTHISAHTCGHAHTNKHTYTHVHTLTHRGGSKPRGGRGSRGGGRGSYKPVRASTAAVLSDTDTSEEDLGEDDSEVCVSVVCGLARDCCAWCVCIRGVWLGQRLLSMVCVRVSVVCGRAREC